MRAKMTRLTDSCATRFMERNSQSMIRRLQIISLMLIWASTMIAQANAPAIIGPLLNQHIQRGELVADQLRHFMLARVPPLVLPSSTKDADIQAAALRARVLSVYYHGWPEEWVKSPPKFEAVGVSRGHGYTITKLRYEIVPSFYSAGLLYRPEHVSGKIPAILNLVGHGYGGKAVEHDQKRCINQARQGIIALSLDWFGYGELASPGNSHDFLGLLDLAGYEGAGLFYLEMRRGLDYLYQDGDVDRSRIGVTGVSTGGLRTLLLSSLDTRVGPALPVAGFSSLTTTIEHPEYPADDAEQYASDLRLDFAELLAARAPRPTQLIYNAMDDCCFRADIVKQGVYSDIKPFFALYGKPDNLLWHLNLDPGLHNYEIDNREVAYRFFDSAFHLDVNTKELPETDTDVKGYEDLVVGLPKDNLTILSLAQSVSRNIHHQVPAQHDAAWTESQRSHLAEVIRYQPVTVMHAWPVVDSTHDKGVEAQTYRFEFSNALTATGVLFRLSEVPEPTPTTVLISDAGMASMRDEVGNDIDRGQRVLVLDPLFFGDNVPLDSPNQDPTGAPGYSQILNSLGERPLGLEAAQVTAIIHWLSKDLDHGSPTPVKGSAISIDTTRPVSMITTGPRSQTLGLVAVALHPELFSALEARKSIPSLHYAFDHPLTYQDAPELMCLDLYRDFDFNILAMVAEPVPIDLSAAAHQRIFW